MLRNRIQLLAKWHLLLLLGGLAVACTNKMLPVSNPPVYRNTLVADTQGRWRVVPIQCPILFDEYGRFEPGKNLGCSQVHNLGLMIANPEDLLADTDFGDMARKPLIFREQPLAISAQAYYDGKLSKLQQTDIASGYYQGSGVVGTGMTP